MNHLRPLFPLGTILATQGALNAVPYDELLVALVRHAAGDWGQICDEDRAANTAALAHGSRLLSAYRSHTGRVFWIITEADRSSTTFLLPEEY